MTDLKVAAQRALNLMDLTTLNDDDTDQKVIDLCHKAKSPAGLTAAVCITPVSSPSRARPCVTSAQPTCASRP
ncbi:hypothetical protein ACLK2G_23120 [Escherichia coli]